MAESLGRFLKQNAATLDTCASEPIHLSGSIQDVGALLIIDPDSLTIAGASENISARLDCSPWQGLLGQPFETVFPTLHAELRDLPLDDEGVHHTLAERYPAKDDSFDVACHSFSGFILIEFIPTTSHSDRFIRDKMRFTQNACARILKADTFEQGLEFATTSIRELTGFGKSMVYQFMPDWSGHVIAESREESYASYKGLFFPAHDIPEQARHLYSIVPSRSVGSAEDNNSRIAVLPDIQNVDLTYSMLRSVSPIHTAYFRNMGLQSSFSVGLRFRGTLWGLVVCHNSEPAFLPLDLRRLAEDIAGALMARLQQEQITESAERIHQLRHIEAAVAAELIENRDLSTTLQKFMPELRAFMGGDGFAFELDGEIHVDGVTPPLEFIHEVIALGIESGANKVFVESALPKIMPAAMQHRETACGVLLQPVKLHRSCMLIWFRGPMQSIATWAGDPNEKVHEVRPDGTHSLTPRNSFAQWNDAHLNIALPWSAVEIDVAQSLFQQILDLIAYQAIRIRKLNDAHNNLATFTHSTVHDIRGPLRSIDMALAELREPNPSGAPEDAELREALARAAEISVERLSKLVEQVLSFIEVENSGRLEESFALGELVDDIENLLMVEMSERKASVERLSMGIIHGNRPLLTTALQNLVQNSLNYKHPERDPVIRIDLETDEDKQRIIVTDNGIGIEAKFAERIFEPFKRLHRRDEIEGTGIGLASVLRVAELHGGTAYLDATFDPAQGSRFVVEIEASGVSQN